jgi:hypothetical protein
MSMNSQDPPRERPQNPAEGRQSQEAGEPKVHPQAPAEGADPESDAGEE